MRFLPQTVLIVLMADSAKAISCLPAVPATRRAKEMMYELNASPLGEKYDATESTKTQGRHFLGRALVAADYDVGSMLGCIFLFQEYPFLGPCFSFLPGFLRIPQDSFFFRRNFFTGTSFWQG